MEPVEALHTAARRYCFDRCEELRELGLRDWQIFARDLEAAGRDWEAAGVRALKARRVERQSRTFTLWAIQRAAEPIASSLRTATVQEPEEVSHARPDSRHEF